MAKPGPSSGVPIAAIHVSGSRDVDPAEIERLAESIKLVGLINPVTVETRAGRIELIAGRNRIAACKLLGWENIPVVDRDAIQAHHDNGARGRERREAERSGFDELSTIDENLIRVDLGPERDELMKRRVALLTSLGHRRGSGGARSGAGARKTSDPKPGAEKRRGQRNRPAGATNQNDSVTPNPSAAGPASVQERRAAAREHDAPGRPATPHGDAVAATAAAAGVSRRTAQRAVAAKGEGPGPGRGRKPKPPKPASPKAPAVVAPPPVAAEVTSWRITLIRAGGEYEARFDDSTVAGHGATSEAALAMIATRAWLVTGKGSAP